MKYNLEMNKMDYQKEKENRKKRLEAYAEEIQKSTLKKSAEVIEQLVKERHRQGMTQQDLSDLTGILPPNLARLESHKNMERTTGPSLMGEIFEISVKKGYRHYFYGSKEETLELLYQKLTSNYPGIQIAGMYSPPFRPMTEEEDKAIIERINETNPDFVWVGLGAPKQEKWMAAHQGKIDGLMLGVGAGFDYYAENIKRAPMWMQKHNLEWVYRLVQDPKRLFKRYWSTNTKFIWNAMIRGK